MASGIVRIESARESANVRLVKPAQRDVPKEWEVQLAELSPPTNRFSWLKLIWEPGYPWEPVERYLIYQMVPRHGIPLGFLEQLEDPHPPSAHGNYYDQHKEWVDEKGVSRRGQFIRNPDCIITERAWHLYRDTKCWGRPFWVIQGAEGGHKRWFSPNEKKFLKMAGLPTESPPPGDLPYADFDDRVMARLTTYDLLKGQHAGLRRKKTLLQGLYSSRYEEDERAFREQFVKWLAEQVTELDPERITKSMMKLDMPRIDMDDAKIQAMQEQAEENFIVHGRTHGGIKLHK